MSDNQQDALTRWLRLEAAGATVRAEEAFSALLRHLPERVPSMAFEDGIMSRLQWHPRAAARELGRWWQAVAIVLLLVLGLTAAALPAVLLALPIPVGGLISALASTIAGAVEWMAGGLSLWRFFADFAEKVALVLATPQATLVVVGFVSLGAGALRLLYGLTVEDRRYVHVDSV